jgi:hypothetical protein
MRMLEANRTQTAIHGRRTHLQQERFGLRRQLKFTASLQHLHYLWQKWMEPRFEQIRPQISPIYPRATTTAPW